MHRYNDATANLDSKTRRKQQDERRMRFRRAIESYAEQRQLQQELVDFPEPMVAGYLRNERALAQAVR
ncbi:PA3496 family putative envelope integrity protein [Pseudomonas sp.]|uniref:PA3496 family putative envelope integrity protein n=1 Tax=Pseudomonas sp. TaxID=306 RepID=UPI003D0E067B